MNNFNSVEVETGLAVLLPYKQLATSQATCARKRMAEPSDTLQSNMA